MALVRQTQVRVAVECGFESSPVGHGSFVLEQDV